MAFFPRHQMVSTRWSGFAHVPARPNARTFAVLAASREAACSHLVKTKSKEREPSPRSGDVAPCRALKSRALLSQELSLLVAQPRPHISTWARRTWNRGVLMRCVPRRSPTRPKRRSLCWHELQRDGRGSRFARLSHLACGLLISRRSLGKRGMQLPVDSPCGCASITLIDAVMVTAAGPLRWPRHIHRDDSA